MAEKGGRTPPTLYNACMTRLVKSTRSHDTSAVRELPDTVLLDVYYQMLADKKLCLLGAELSQLDVFTRLLCYAPPTARLLTCFQAVMEHGTEAADALAAEYTRRCARPASARDRALAALGLQLGEFLSEAGWYAAAERVLLACEAACERVPAADRTRLTLECLQRLLNTQAAYCSFPGATATYTRALKLLGLLDELESPAAAAAAADVAAECSRRQQEWSRRDGALPAAGWGELVPRLYKEFSELSFVRCDYNAAYKWSTRALNLLTTHTSPKTATEVVRMCGKACVVKRRFARAGLLMRQAVATARASFGERHPRYACSLLDYGYYLLNIDSIVHSVAVYKEALSVLQRVFGGRSLHVATAEEDLAYALYVHEYSSGRFYKAKEHAERAIHIIEGLVPSDHLLLASAKRVKALILEEIALDTQAGQNASAAQSQGSLLEESEELHKAALELSMMAFGEKNVQTAKHYGNLGRLYQSMQKFEDAEMMHLKAIAIKEELLGAEDYEVGLSIGHLASLYNYHMNMYRSAEQLYSRSIAISLKLFGERYSGLEYDYRGLVNVFTQQKKYEQARHYNDLLHQWHDLREMSRAVQPPGPGEEQALPLTDLLRGFSSA